MTHIASIDAAPPSGPLSLAHWRRSIAELYAMVRATTSADQAAAAARFRTARDALFGGHPDSPLDGSRRQRFRGLRYFPYDPSWRTLGELACDETSAAFVIELGTDGPLTARRIGEVRARLRGRAINLSVYWLEGYGGGLWLPFGDASNGLDTYGGGRYLYDTIKGADLGNHDAKLVLDFNYAYNPSCCYDNRWVCPLAPAENRLDLAVTAGERQPEWPR